MKKTFSIKEPFVFGWQTMRAHSALVFKVALTMLALQVAFEIVMEVLVPSAIGMLAAIVLMVFLIVTGFGASIISLKLARGTVAHYKDLLPSVKFVVRYVLASILVGLMVLAPLLVAGIIVAVVAVVFGVSFVGGTVAHAYVSFWVLCVSISLLLAMALTLSGYLLLRYSFVRFAVVDTTTVLGSLGESVRLVRGHTLEVFGFFIALLALNLLGMLLFLVGLLVTIPVTMIAYAHVYQKLKGHVETR